MHYLKIFFVVIGIVGIAYVFSIHHDASFKNTSAFLGETASSSDTTIDADTNEPILVSAPMLPRHLDSVRALYMTMYTAATQNKLDKLISTARRNNINAFVIDVKDSSGILFFPLESYDTSSDPDIVSRPYLVKRGPTIVSKLREQGF